MEGHSIKLGIITDKKTPIREFNIVDPKTPFREQQAKLLWPDYGSKLCHPKIPEQQPKMV